MLNYFNGRLIKVINKNKKEEVIEELVDLINSNTNLVENKEEFIKGIMERESIGSTCIGMGIALPHTRLDGIKDIVVAFGIMENPIEFDSIDMEPIKIVVLVGAPKEKTKEYLKVLSDLAKIFRNRKYREAIKSSKDQLDMVEALMEITEL